MKNSSQSRLINHFFLIPLLFVMSSSPLYAYTDQVTVKAEEAWAAAKEVLKKHGFKKIDEKNYVLETKWMEDEVVRSRGLVKKFSQGFQRRYRLTVKIKQRDYDSEISVNGKYQERIREQMQQHLMTWKTIRPEGQDFGVERNVFMQILTQLQLMKMGETPTPAQ